MRHGVSNLVPVHHAQGRSKYRKSATEHEEQGKWSKKGTVKIILRRLPKRNEKQSNRIKENLDDLR